VWFVSHCKAPSGRDEYVENLKIAINQLSNTKESISIYGKCGTSGIARGTPEEQNEMSQTKFHISFENAKCPEYVTEKLYRVINQNISQNPPVPIVMGPNKEWYTQNLPTKSFIHVDEFKSPFHLAKYLIFLHSNNEEYMKYLEWRRFHARFEDESIRCKLCKSLLDDTHNKEGDLRIEDFNKFWNKARCARREPYTLVRFP